MHAPMKLFLAESLLAERLERFKAEGTPVTKQVRRRAMREVSNAVNKSFGGQNWERMFWDSPIARQMLNWGHVRTRLDG